MSLPKIASPTYQITMPSNGKKIKFRPYLVKEQKILLMASQGGTFEEAYDAIKQIATNCTFGEIDVENMPLFDLEYLFLHIRAKSVGETITPSIKCETCSKNVNLTINLTEAKISNKPDNNIKLTENMGIVLNFPSFNITKLEAREESVDNDFEAIYECVDHIYEGSQIFSKKDFTLEEFKTNILEGLSIEMYEKIVDFFSKIPSVYLETTARCACGTSKEIRLSGVQDFLF